MGALKPRAMGRAAYRTSMLVLAVLLTAMLWGCASPGVNRQWPPASEKEMVEAAPGGWWYARFVMNWPEGRDPFWYLDPLLAHRVVAPVLDRYGGEIVLWRFHRRAARDQAGHQFSFIFFSSQQTARRIFAALQSDPVLAALKQRGLVARDGYDDPNTITRPHIEDTSDRHWPLSIQKSWPYYLQGASEMWLNLIVEMVNQLTGGKLPASMEELLRFYERLNGEIGRLWREEGQHAFLHHLNALFGYEPLMVREKRLMEF